MQSPRFNLDDVNDSIVIFFFLLFSQMAEWRRGGGGWGVDWRGRGHKMSGLGRATVRGKAQAMTAVSSCSRAFTALHIIMSHVDKKKKKGHFRKELDQKNKAGFTTGWQHRSRSLVPPALLYLLVKATQITAINKVQV